MKAVEEKVDIKPKVLVCTVSHISYTTKQAKRECSERLYL